MSENLIGQIITAIVTLIVAFIGYLKLKVGQDKIHKEIDGVKTELVEAVKGRGRAEGQLIGIEKAKQDAIDTAVDTAGVQPVKIVEQTKTIDVTIKKKDKK